MVPTTADNGLQLSSQQYLAAHDSFDLAGFFLLFPALISPGSCGNFLFFSPPERNSLPREKATSKYAILRRQSPWVDGLAYADSEGLVAVRDDLDPYVFSLVVPLFLVLLISSFPWFWMPTRRGHTVLSDAIFL